MLFSEEAQKATQFIQLANQIDTPLLFLHNTTGYMVGKEYEQGGIIKHGAHDDQRGQQLHRAAPHRASWARRTAPGNYGMNGRAYDPRFLFTWPSAKSAVMGPAQLAGRAVDRRAGRPPRRKGKAYDEEADAAMRALRRGSRSRSRVLPFFLSGMLYDDGVIDPRDTRTVLGICLSVIAQRARSRAPTRFGVFRM